MKRATIALALLALAAPAGLATAPLAAAQQTEAAPAYADASRLEVIYVTRTTQRRIQFGAPLFGVVGTLPKLEVEVSNPTGSERRYEYLVEWYGQDGSRTQTSNMWRSIYLLPNERQTIRSMGQLPEAWRARLTVRETSKRPS
jgi:uncharacterized protein YcfL